MVCAWQKITLDQAYSPVVFLMVVVGETGSKRKLNQKEKRT
jgi:hypothetical protein